MPKIPFNKPALSCEEQLKILTSRGMVFDNTQHGLTQLSSISYYRLSAYWYPFRQRQDGRILSSFEPGTSFHKIIALYEFDRQLRLLVMDAVERIEIAVRARINQDLSLKYKPFFHINSKNFHPKFKHHNWLKGIQTEVERSNDDFIKHFKNKYQDFPNVPLWCTTEIMSLGKLSHMYRGLLPEDKKTIALYFNIHPKRLADWLHVISYVRNICAHHSRLWNRSLSIRPEAVKDEQWLPPLTPRNDRIFYILLMLRILMKASGNGKDWKQKIEALIDQLNPDENALKRMGIPDDWKNHPIWT